MNPWENEDSQAVSIWFRSGETYFIVHPCQVDPDVLQDYLDNQLKKASSIMFFDTSRTGGILVLVRFFNQPKNPFARNTLPFMKNIWRTVVRRLASYSCDCDTMHNINVDF